MKKIAGDQGEIFETKVENGVFAFVYNGFLRVLVVLKKWLELSR